MIMWIKWQNLATPAACLPRLTSPRHAHGLSLGPACARAHGPARPGHRRRQRRVRAWHSFVLFSASQLR